MQAESEDIETVLRFWFGGGDDDGDRDLARVAKAQEKLWWGGDRDTDELIRRRFAPLHAKAARGALDDWQRTPHGRLALILVLDQFSRNLYRGTPAAFAQDPRARRLCAEGLATQVDRKLGLLERVFFYLPLEHAESREDQARSVAVYEALGEHAPVSLRGLLDDYTKFAKDHRDVIARFGRFPHRNAILGRESTAEEQNFLAQPGSSF